MRTGSIWGKPPTRIYKFMNIIKKRFGSGADICVIGASDGKFVMPFLREGFHVTAYEIDDIAVYGGEKEFPCKRDKIQIQSYKSNPLRNPIYVTLPSEMKSCLGLKKRAEREAVEHFLTIRMENFYKNPPSEKYHVIFTSCSIPYPCNFDIPVSNIIQTLKNAVLERGVLYMDYMMPLEDAHEWRPEHYLRKGNMKKFFFDEEWNILYLREMKKPVFEAAHVDRPEDHFHRFGYILAEHIH